MTPLNRAELIAIAVLALLAGAMLGAPVGGWLGARYATARGEVQLSDLRREYAKADAAAVSSASQRLAQETDRGNKLSAQLLVAEAQIETLSRQLSKRVDHVTTVYREAPGAALQPIPRCVFIRGWLRDYNLAIGAAMPAAREGTGAPVEAADASAAAGGEDELAPADIDAKSILTHQIEYGARCQKLEEQLNQLIDFNEGVDVQQ